MIDTILYFLSLFLFLISQIIFTKNYDKPIPGLIPICFSLVCLFLAIFLDHRFARHDQVIAFHLLVITSIFTIGLLFWKIKHSRKNIHFVKKERH